MSTATTWGDPIPAVCTAQVERRSPSQGRTLGQQKGRGSWGLAGFSSGVSLTTTAAVTTFARLSASRCTFTIPGSSCTVNPGRWCGASILQAEMHLQGTSQRRR
uniref:Uncharacterized protein n=1 Tax=Physcomitrium patens TaxID=3218 RepID=A0A2K1IRU7_PHYPA|nr:hypothetical protein PHYPA_026118 [Physcomitrium patens]